MSDFLSKFTKENYDRERMRLSENSSNPVEDSSETEANSLEEILEEVSKKAEPTFDQKERTDDERSYIREEPTEIDPEYKQKRKNKIILISILSLILLITGGVIYNQRSHTKMPDFTNVARQEVTSWANKNKIQVIYEEEFNNEIDEDIIISQSVPAKEKIKKGSDLQMVVSLGADPDEIIQIPDFSKMAAKEIEDWVNTNKLRYVQVEYIYSEDVDKDTFLKFEIKDKDVSNDKFYRKNKALITLSKGKETFEKEILVLDFNKKMKQDVETWMKEKEFINKFVFEEEYSDDKMEDEIISQSVDPGEKVAKDEVLNFTISKGKAVKTPDYSDSEMNTFDTINSNGAMVMSKELYTMGYPYGSFVEQSVEAGTILNDKPETIVIVYYSLGKPYINDLVGQSEGSLPAFFYEFKGKGANISYDVYTIKSCEPKGTVVKASKNNEYITTSDHVDVYISDGSGVCDIPPIDQPGIQE